MNAPTHQSSSSENHANSGFSGSSGSSASLGIRFYRGSTLSTADTLTSAINGCCDLRGDDAQNRAALLAEVATLTVEQQLDLIEHFDGETQIWARATGAAT